MLLPNLATTMDKIRQLLVPDGKFVAVVWDVPPKVPMASVPMGVVLNMLQPPSPPPGVPSTFSLSGPGVLEQAFNQARLKDVHSERMTAMIEFTSVEEYIQYLKDITPINAQLAHLPAERQTEVWQAITDAAQAYTAADGSVRMTNETICAVGRR